MVPVLCFISGITVLALLFSVYAISNDPKRAAIKSEMEKIKAKIAKSEERMKVIRLELKNILREKI